MFWSGDCQGENWRVTRPGISQDLGEETLLYSGSSNLGRIDIDVDEMANAVYQNFKASSAQMIVPVDGEDPH